LGEACQNHGDFFYFFLPLFGFIRLYLPLAAFIGTAPKREILAENAGLAGGRGWDTKDEWDA
jgi:hypothetical protein